jgi:hypothetical protein
MTMPTKITTLIQNINPDSDMNAQKNSPNELNIYSPPSGQKSQKQHAKNPQKSQATAPDAIKNKPRIFKNVSINPSACP